jgi:hypothetical protein
MSVSLRTLPLRNVCFALQPALSVHLRLFVKNAKAFMVSPISSMVQNVASVVLQINLGKFQTSLALTALMDARHASALRFWNAIAARPIQTTATII